MQIEYLKIKNFKILKDVELYPSSFVNVFSGENGEGKSSIAEAIKYILTDQLEYKMEHYINWNADQAELFIRFNHLGKKYEYEIVLTVKGAKKKLVIDDEEEFINSEATKKLAEIIDPTITAYSAISEQDKGTALISESGAKKLQILKEIFKIDKIDVVVEELKNDIKDAKNKSEVLLKEIELLEQNKFELQEVPQVESIDKIQIVFDALQKEKVLYDEQIKSYNNYVEALKRYNELQIKIKELEEKVIVAEKELKEHSVSIESYKNVNDSELEKLNNRMLEIKTMIMEQENNVKKLNDYKVTKKKLEKKKVVIESSIAEIRITRIAACTISQESVDEDEIRLNSMKVDLKDFENKIKLAEQGNCPTCGKPFEYNLDILKDEKHNVELGVKSLTEKIFNAKKIIQEYKDLQQDQDLKRKEKELLSKELDSVTKELSELKEPVFIVLSIDDAKQELLDIEHSISDIKNSITRKKELENKIDKCNNVLNVNNSLLEEYKKTVKPEEVNKPNDFDEVLFADCQKKIYVYESKIKEKERIEKFNEEQLEKKEENKKTIEQKKIDYNLYQKNISIWEETKNVLDKGFASYLIDKGAKFIKDQMNDFFMKCYGKYEISFEQNKNSIEFYYTDGTKIVPCGLASGWEKALISMCNRQALCSIQNLNFNLLDEADSASSENNSLKAFQYLLNSLKDTQFFIISHKETLKDYLMNLGGCNFYEIEKGKVK